MKLYRKPGEPLWFTEDPNIFQPAIVCEVSKEDTERMGLEEEAAMSR